MKCKQVPLSTLKPGVVLKAPIVDPVDSRIKLLADGIAITDQFIERLSERGIDSIMLSQGDIAVLEAFTPQGRRIKVPPPPEYVTSRAKNDYTEAIDTHIVDQPSIDFKADGQPMADGIDVPADCDYADGLPVQWAQDSAERIEAVSECLEDSLGGGQPDVGPLRKVIQELVRCLGEDRDALVCMACAPYESDYPSRHGVHLATVAMAIGTELDLDEASLVELGVGCLIHDVGMRAVGLGMFDTGRPLGPGQLKRLADHPVKAIEIAGECGDQLSELARYVVYQIHERGDGTGYPRGYTAGQIHPLAKIAGVADAFVGMLTPRKHRLAIQGYYAIVNLLDQMKSRKFDARVIRGLIKSSSLYPLGSMVSLSNDHVGRVIRSGGDEFVLPTIQMWSKDGLDKPPAIVNLKHEMAIQITGSIPIKRAA